MLIGDGNLFQCELGIAAYFFQEHGVMIIMIIVAIMFAGDNSIGDRWMSGTAKVGGTM